MIGHYATKVSGHILILLDYAEYNSELVGRIYIVQLTIYIRASGPAGMPKSDQRSVVIT